MLAAVLFVLAVFWTAPADAACSCVCEAGKVRAVCPSVFEIPPQCPARTCADERRAAPPMDKHEVCRVVQDIDPGTGRVTRRLVCK
jgi:hypothetical protein